MELKKESSHKIDINPNNNNQIERVNEFYFLREITKNNNKNNEILNLNSSNRFNIEQKSNLVQIDNPKTRSILENPDEDNNINEKDIIDNALLSQISDINIKLILDSDANNEEPKNLPKIEFIELALLNQGLFTITEFKKFGFGIYVFFFYLRNQIISFFLLFVFAFYYMYCIFFKYYPQYEDEYSYFDYNLLTLVSGVQIIRYRKYYIDKYGKEAFLEKYKNFDVFYKEYIFSGTILFIFVFLINFIWIIYLIRTYESYKLETQENYSLILSGEINHNKNLKEKENLKTEDKKQDKEIEDIYQYQRQDTEKNVVIDINEEEDYSDEKMKDKIFEELNIRDRIEDVDINFTFELSEYYKKIEDINSSRKEYTKLRYKTEKNKCCCRCCCCFCTSCFICCCCPCCNKNKITEKKDNINIKNSLLKTKLKIDKKSKRNQLYIITFKYEENFKRIYNKYPHYYLTNCIRNKCKKDEDKNYLYTNKAPKPEEIAWENLEFSKEYDYCNRKFCLIFIYFIFILISFIIQTIGDIIVDKLFEIMAEKIHDIFNNELFTTIVNILISIALEKLNDKFEDKIDDAIKDNTNYWSYSDITYYCILHKSIFKFINQGIIPFCTYLLYEKVINKNNNDDYSNLASKMFVILEMDGFGYPIADLIYSFFKKMRDINKNERNEINIDNVKKEISESIQNKKGLTRYELNKAYKKKSMKLEEDYADVLAIYWITMFYLPIYPIGIIQSFLNLLFKFINEKNFLSNFYKRPEYINPEFGFLCFNFFNFGFFLFLFGNLIFFINEDNKSSFGVNYIICMVILLIFPFYYLAKLLTFCCQEKVRIDFNFNGEITVLISNIKDKFKEVIDECIQKLSLNPEGTIFKVNNINGKEINPKETIERYMTGESLRKRKIDVFVDLIKKNNNNLIDNNDDNIKSDINHKKVIINDYKIFNPYYQRERLIEIFSEFKSNKLLSKSQYEYLENKIKYSNEFTQLDLYKFSQKMKIPRYMTFEERILNSEFLFQNPIKDVNNEEKKKLYYLLMQLGFLSYGDLNISSEIKFNNFNETFTQKDIKSFSLKNLSKQENLSTEDSGNFTTFYYKDKLIMAYVDNEDDVKIFDVFNRKVLCTLVDPAEKIIFVKSFNKIVNKETIPMIALLTINNKIYFYDLTKNENLEDIEKEENIKKKADIENIGDTWSDDKNKENKIFSLSTIQHNKKTWIITSYFYDKNFKIYEYDENTINKPEIISFNENIISIEGFYFTEENTFILIKSTDNDNIRINLFINKYFIKQLSNDIEKDFYINFKIINIYRDSIYIIITKFKKNLSEYIIQILDISNIFPKYKPILELQRKNKYTASLFLMPDSDINNPIDDKKAESIRNNSFKEIFNFSIKMGNNYTEEQINIMKEYLEKNDERHNIGNMIYWEKEYIIIGTPFGLDIIDFSLQQKICSINLNDNKINENIIDNINFYNFSEKIEDAQFGEGFILGDNQGKIKYIRASKKNQFNFGYRIIKSNDHFNNLENELKLNRLNFTNNFYLLYILISFLLPLIAALLGHFGKFSFDFPYLVVLSACYGSYVFFGIWFKGCIADINEENSSTKNIIFKIIYIILIVVKVFANSIFAFWFCKKNKTGLIFIICLFSIYLIHLLINFLIKLEIIISLKSYLISYIFYQFSRVCILLFFILSIFFEFNHVETYYYAATLCIVMLYMHMADYFNILMKDLVYSNYIQAIFNFPMEWMNFFCCWFITPIDCIRDCDSNYFYDILYILLLPLEIVLLVIFIAIAIAVALACLAIGIIFYILYSIFSCLFCCCEKKTDNNNETKK